MSLFKTRDWWSVASEVDDSALCHVGHLIIGNIANESTSPNKIIVGTFSGNIKIYAPQSTYNEEEEKEIVGFRPDHLVLEVSLGEPVLQLAIGKFVSGNNGLHLCVLHSDHFIVYSVAIIEGQVGHGSQAKLTKNYQHNFKRKAYSITSGNFGFVKGRDFIAVQSLDGCVTFYEQERVGFICFLPEFLLPVNLVYIPSSDSLVTQSSDWTLRAYKYQMLSTLDQEGSKNTNSVVKTSSKKVLTEWAQIMSEVAIDIKVLLEPGDVCSVLVLTTRSFSCFKDSGILRFVKKIDYKPSCFTAFHNNKHIEICVATHTQTLLVYKETELKWASQLPFVPVSIERADFKGIRGSLVLLGESGQLLVGFLGTDPSLFAAPPPETREINYEQTDKEMNELNKIIRNSTKDTGSLVNLGKGARELLISTTLGGQLESWVGHTNVFDPAGVPSVSMVVRLMTQSPLNNVRVAVDVQKPLAVTQDNFVISAICDNCQILVKFYLLDQFIPPSLIVTIVISYIAVNGAPYVTTHQRELPLNLVFRSVSPEKEADHKVTISTNKAAVNLQDLFPEFGEEGSVSTAVGFQLYGDGGATVTLLSSRTTNRYRIQSDCLPAIWLIFSALRNRLESHWGVKQNEAGRGEESLALGVASSIPTQELFAEIDAHFIRRRKQEELEEQLSKRSTQFRAVQKRLLTKFKDKTPTPLTNLDNLLEGTYKQILQITDAINVNIKGLEEDGSRLSCVLRLVAGLLCLQSGLEEGHQKDLVDAALFPTVYHDMTQGWEEVTDNIVTFVLRSSLGKGTRGGLGPPLSVSMPSDTNKIKKHIATFVDGVQKGGLADTHAGNIRNLEPIVTKDSRASPTGDDPFATSVMGGAEGASSEVPPGSRLGEGRARSARLRSARLLSTAKVPQTVREEADGESVDGYATLIDPVKLGTLGAIPDLPPESGLPERSAKDQQTNEPIYSEIGGRQETDEEEKKDKEGEEEIKDKDEEKEGRGIDEGEMEELKKRAVLKEAVIETPQDIFGDPIDEEGW